MIVNRSIFVLILIYFAVIEGTVGQNNKDLYITYTTEQNIEKINTVTDSVEYVIYEIVFSYGNNLSKTLKIGKDGMLQKFLNVKGTHRSCWFTYDSEKGKNLPTIVRRIDMVNVISVSELNNQVDLHEFSDVLRHFKNIYIVKLEDDVGKYHVARRVFLGPDFIKL